MTVIVVVVVVVVISVMKSTAYPQKNAHSKYNGAVFKIHGEHH